MTVNAKAYVILPVKIGSQDYHDTDDKKNRPRR